MGGRHPLHAGRLAARGAAFQLHRGARDLALGYPGGLWSHEQPATRPGYPPCGAGCVLEALRGLPSEHGLVFLFADGLAEGSGDRDELFRRASQIAQCHGGLPAYPLDPDTGAQREKPLLAFACSNSGRGRSEVLVPHPPDGTRSPILAYPPPPAPPRYRNPDIGGRSAVLGHISPRHAPRPPSRTHASAAGAPTHDPHAPTHAHAPGRGVGRKWKGSAHTGAREGAVLNGP